MDSHDIKECIYYNLYFNFWRSCEITFNLSWDSLYNVYIYIYKQKTYNCRIVSHLLLALVNFSTSLIPAHLLYTINWLPKIKIKNNINIKYIKQCVVTDSECLTSRWFASCLNDSTNNCLTLGVICSRKFIYLLTNVFIYILYGFSWNSRLSSVPSHVVQPKQTSTTESTLALKKHVQINLSM